MAPLTQHYRVATRFARDTDSEYLIKTNTPLHQFVSGINRQIIDIIGLHRTRQALSDLAKYWAVEHAPQLPIQKAVDVFQEMAGRAKNHPERWLTMYLPLTLQIFVLMCHSTSGGNLSL